MEDKKKFMAKAIELSINSANTIGGPFGSVIVKDNKIISEGSNKVTSSNDPTAHGEVVAIREACKNLKLLICRVVRFIHLVNLVQCVFLQFIGQD